MNTSFVHPASGVGFPSQLNLMHIDPTQVQIKSVCDIYYSPIAPLPVGKNSINFDIPASENEYTDLSSLFMYVTVNFKGTTNEQAPINLLLHSLFSNIEMTLNG